MRYSFKFDLGCFPTTVHVMFGYDTLDEVIDKYELNAEYFEFEPDDEDCLALTLFSYNKGNCYLLFKDIVTNMDDMVSIVHEITHAVGNIFKYYDTPLNDDTTEVYAYTAGYIFSTVMKEVEKKQGIKVVCQKKK